VPASYAQVNALSDARGSLRTGPSRNAGRPVAADAPATGRDGRDDTRCAPRLAGEDGEVPA